MRSFRVTRWLCLSGALTALTAAASPALAQGVALDRFDPAPAGDRMFGVESPFAAGQATPHVALLLDYGHNPYTLRHGPGLNDRGAVVSDQLFLHLNASMSIFHRMTGAALYFGTLLLAWWLIAAAVGPSYFNFVNGLFGSLLGKVVLIGYTWALIHHALGGVRHFVWDTGRGYDLETIDRMSWGSIAVSLIATAVIWFVVATQQGGL